MKLTFTLAFFLFLAVKIYVYAAHTHTKGKQLRIAKFIDAEALSSKFLLRGSFPESGPLRHGLPKHQKIGHCWKNTSKGYHLSAILSS